jgi:Ca2+-binding RTX toxin-like protein
MAYYYGIYARDTYVGTSMADWIFGFGGNDTLQGGAGDDYIRGDFHQNGSNPLPNFPTTPHVAGNDYIDGGDGNDRLYGDGGNDVIYGGHGADFLDGGTGTDAMAGGYGDDTYVVDNAGDIVYESWNGGTDTVYSSVNHTLQYAVENLVLVDTALQGFGNTLNNRLIGNQVANYLNGLEGDDLLFGGDGNDLLAGGDGNDELYGDDGDDRIEAGAGNDLLVGAMGRDVMTGGFGNDTFRFASVDESPAGAQRDVITDFHGMGMFLGDRIDLSAIDANLAIAGNQAFLAAQISYVGGILTADVLFGADFQVELAGAPALLISGPGSDIIF